MGNKETEKTQRVEAAGVFLCVCKKTR